MNTFGAPTCIAPGCTKQTRRVPGSNIPKRGKRMLNGIHWGWFCSRSCSGRDKGHVNIEACRRVGHGNRARAERRVLQRLVEACKDVMDEQQRVPATAMVKVMMIEIRKAYSRGLTAMYRQRERAA